MLIEDDYVAKFYNVIKNRNPLVLVNTDVDAFCASLILFHAFSIDDVTFASAPVRCFADLKEAVDNSETDCIVLINCAGHLSLVELKSDVSIFVLDSRRPLHVDNIYSEGNVNLLVQTEEAVSWRLPDIDTIYADDSDEEDVEDGDDDESDVLNRRIQKRRDREQWLKKRSEALLRYQERSWFALSSAVFLLRIIHTMSKSTAQTLWCAAVGLNAQYIDDSISLSNYLGACADLRDLVNVYSTRNRNASSDMINITLDTELLLPLYAKWNIIESMRHDVFFCCENKLWTQQGESNLKHTLANIGIALEEARQPFSSLSSTRRDEIRDILDKKMNVAFAGFFAQRGFTQHFSATDFARILAIQLEDGSSSTSLIDRHNAARALMYNFFANDGQKSFMDNALKQGKTVLQAIRGLAFAHLSMIRKNGSFYRLQVDQSADLAYLLSRNILYQFIVFIYSCFKKSPKSKKSDKPLLVILPSPNNDENNRMSIVCGWTISGEEKTSFIPLLFKEVLRKTGIEVTYPYMDPSIVQLPQDECNRFLDAFDVLFSP